MITAYKVVLNHNGKLVSALTFICNEWTVEYFQDHFVLAPYNSALFVFPTLREAQQLVDKVLWNERDVVEIWECEVDRIIPIPAVAKYEEDYQLFWDTLTLNVLPPQQILAQRDYSNFVAQKVRLTTMVVRRRYGAALTTG